MLPGHSFNFILPGPPDRTFLLTGAVLPATLLLWNYQRPLRLLLSPSARRTARNAGQRVPTLRNDWDEIFVPTGVFLLLWLGSLNGIALLRYAVSGHAVTAVVTVQDPRAPDYSRGACAGEIDLTGYITGRLCYQPDSLRDALHKGQELRVSGTGTAWGLFVDKVTPLHG